MTPINPQSAAILATIKSLLTQDLVSLDNAVKAVYRLGHLDGGLEMAKVGERGVQELREQIAKAA